MGGSFYCIELIGLYNCWYGARNEWNARTLMAESTGEIVKNHNVKICS